MENFERQSGIEPAFHPFRGCVLTNCTTDARFAITLSLTQRTDLSAHWICNCVKPIF